MHQKSLFPAIIPDEPRAPASSDSILEESSATEWSEPPAVLSGQLHLFSDRAARLGKARAAIAEARLDEARRLLVELSKRFPQDPHLARTADRTSRLARAFKAAQSALLDTRPAALLGFARCITEAGEPWASLRRTVLGQLARELDARGDGVLLEGEPAGFYMIEAGLFDNAVTSLSRALNISRSARLLFRLGDARFLAGRRAEARRTYLQALVVNPFDMALSTASDEGVRGLPGVARDEIEIEEEPTAWSAPVGVVAGTLPSPVGIPREVLAVESAVGRAHAGQCALEKAREFMRALIDAASPEGRGEGAVEVRRRMKRLSAPLFAAYMEKMGRKGD